MSYKTIATVVTGADGDAGALRAAIAFAHREEAHLDVLALGIDRTQPGFYYAGANAVIMQDNMVQAQREAEAVEVWARSELDGLDVRWACSVATSPLAGLAPLVAHRTRLADIAVLARPYGSGRGPENVAVVEAALFNGHVPVLIVPDGAELADPLRQVVAAWNESAEALCAIRAALPLLRQADSVSVAIIDPPSHGPDRSDPGGELCQMLARHGVKPDVSVLSRTMPRVSDVLSRHCRDRNAELLVMGAYGHSRFRESILGGATRNMLEQSEIPVLLAH